MIQFRFLWKIRTIKLYHSAIQRNNSRDENKTKLKLYGLDLPNEIASASTQWKSACSSVW